MGTPRRLQDVLANISDEEALAVWHALAAHVENELCSDEVSQERWENPTGGAVRGRGRTPGRGGGSDRCLNTL